MNKFLILVGFLILPLAAGFIGSYFTMPAIPGWYAELIKPELNPPNYVFGPVWTLLYILMGLAAWLVWVKVGELSEGEKRIAKFGLIVWFMQLILNSLWSAVFFGAQNLLVALVVLIGLWVLILVMMILFYRISKLAGWMIAPYLVWVSFAGYLNYMIWALN